ncbi:MAG: radical SAM protein [Halioglobus sp.]|nr:radical SAM protein [Halioglobus sp.]
MTKQVTYLVPGFYLAISEKQHALQFAQLPGMMRRATPVRLAIVDSFNHGFEGDIEDLIAAMVKRFGAKRIAVVTFIENLEMAGCLTDSKPVHRFFGAVSEKLGTVGSDDITIAAPISLLSQDGNFLWYDHDGVLLMELTLAEVRAVSVFAEAITVETARNIYLEKQYPDAMNSSQFDELISRMAGADVFMAPLHIDNSMEKNLFGNVDYDEVQALVDARVAAHDEKIADSGKDLVPVIPVNMDKGMAPASLGLVTAYAMEYEGGKLRERYDFVPMFLADEARIVERAATPGVFIFSNYLWTVDTNLKLSAAIKAVNPSNITIHGGPSTPSYEKDCEMFFADNPHVDVAVRGEGEHTFADLLDKLDIHTADLSVLENVPGISFRASHSVVRNGDRDRIADLNTIPSPYLMGLFDEFGSVRAGAIIESNRGCPYGCTFCDWGSATLSKVRRFDLDRVYAELEWSAKNQIEDASIADANFGMLERDVDIALKIADLRKTYGFPRSVPINYAKNQVRYLRQIIEIFAKVNILTEGLVSLQSMDETTLKVIDRSNIKLEKYHEVAREFRRAKLPLAADIMMGLPGSTRTSFSTDLQKCADMDIRVRANKTTLLPNSPMNEPGYRKEHGIVAKPGEILMEAASYTRKDWEEMDQLRLAYYLFDVYGLLRYVARYVRRETGMGEVAFYDKVRSDASRHPDDWPVISKTLKTLEGYMAPPGSWSLFIAEIGRYLIEGLELTDDSALRTALAVQHAHLPAPDRTFPTVLELEHDYAAWQDLLLIAREEGHRDDWQDHVPRLCEFGPATLVIEDPSEVCQRDIGKAKVVLDLHLHTWELESPVARPRLGALAL